MVQRFDTVGIGRLFGDVDGLILIIAMLKRAFSQRHRPLLGHDLNETGGLRGRHHRSRGGRAPRQLIDLPLLSTFYVTAKGVLDGLCPLLGYRTRPKHNPHHRPDVARVRIRVPAGHDRDCDRLLEIAFAVEQRQRVDRIVWEDPAILVTLRSPLGVDLLVRLFPIVRPLPQLDEKSLTRCDYSLTGMPVSVGNSRRPRLALFSMSRSRLASLNCNL